MQAILTAIILIYNLGSFALYFISAVFFLKHIGVAQHSSIHNLHKHLSLANINLIIVLISLVGCMLMVCAQQHYLQKKSNLMLVRGRKKSWKNMPGFLQIGIIFKSLVITSSFFALTYGLMPLVVVVILTIIFGYGIAVCNWYNFNHNPNKKCTYPMYYSVFLAITYSAGLSILYFNTTMHVILHVLHQKSLTHDQLILLMPNTFFSVLFFIGNSFISFKRIIGRDIRWKHPHFFIENIRSVLFGICTSWKSIINVLSLIALLSLWLHWPLMLFILSIPLFIIIALAQTIFFSNHPPKIAAKTK